MMKDSKIEIIPKLPFSLFQKIRKSFRHTHNVADIISAETNVDTKKNFFVSKSKQLIYFKDKTFKTEKAAEK